MTQGKTVCECGRDDIHSSKDCWTIENTIAALNELAKQAQELDMGYSVTTNLDVKYTLNANQLHYISFLNMENKEIGKLNFDSDKLVFEGDVEQSAKYFMDYLLNAFNQKIEKIKEDAFSDGYDNGYDIGYDAGRD